MSEDPEGDALQAEIDADRRETSEHRRRWVLYAPPLVSLTIAAIAIALSRPRELIAARAIVGGRPVAGEALSFRAMVVRSLPAADHAEPMAGVELRVVGTGVRGRAETTDEEGASEVIVDAPLPPSIQLEGRLPGGKFVSLATVDTAAIALPDPRNGVIPTKRTSGTINGALEVMVAPELSMLAPPNKGAAWIRVRRAGLPMAEATVTFSGEAGLGEDPPKTRTDAAGLARVTFAPTSPPIIATVRAELGGESGSWHGVLGSVLGAPVPIGDGRIASSARAIELWATSSRPRAYVDLWQSGVRVAGGAVTFDKGRGFFLLPPGLKGVIDLEVSTSPTPASADDLAHAASFPMVIANDDVDAWGAIATSPRFDDKVAKAAGAIATYGPPVAATIAFAPVAVPRRLLVSDGLPAALRAETTRIKKVRRAATFAIVGGGLIELGLMIYLGVFNPRKPLDDELRALADEEGKPAAPAKPSRAQGLKFAALAVTAIGIVALVFAALATMAWGMP